MNSNRDYQTQITNLQSENKKLKERLEVLESNSDKVIKDSVALMNKNLELQQCLEIERQAYKNLNELYDIDTKSLLQQNEQLKEENQYLKYANEASDEMLLQLSNEAIEVETENEQLKKENEKLKEELEIEKFDWFIVLNNKLDKYKKVIEILKNKISISVNRTVVWFETEKGCVIFKIDTQQEYDLLKEVLLNDK